jgi:hypothetical protein
METWVNAFVFAYVGQTKTSAHGSSKSSGS